MALHHNPRIVTSGLVIFYDAADINSYPGSGIVLYNVAGSATYPSVTLSGNTSYGSISNGVVNLSGETDASVNGAFLNGLGNLGTTINQDFTSIGWLYRTGSTQAEVFDYRGASFRVAFRISDTNIDFAQRNSSGSPTNVTSVAISNPLLTWGCYALVRNGNLWSFYKNGVLIGANTFTMDETISGSDYSIGISWSDDDYASNTMDGSVGPIMHYTRALSALEIEQNYLAQKSRFGL